MTTHRRCIRASSMSRLLFVHLFLFYSQHTHTHSLSLPHLSFSLATAVPSCKDSFFEFLAHQSPVFFLRVYASLFFLVFSHIKTKIKNASHALLWTPFSFLTRSVPSSSIARCHLSHTVNVTCFIAPFCCYILCCCFVNVCVFLCFRLSAAFSFSLIDDVVVVVLFSLFLISLFCIVYVRALKTN